MLGNREVLCPAVLSFKNKYWYCLNLVAVSIITPQELIWATIFYILA